MVRRGLPSWQTLVDLHTSFAIPVVITHVRREELLIRRIKVPHVGLYAALVFGPKVYQQMAVVKVPHDHSSITKYDTIYRFKRLGQGEVQ